MLKNSSAAILLFVVLANTTPINAQTVEDNSSPGRSYSVSPRNLISLASQGRFKEQGVPSYSNFRNSVLSGKVTAEVLVESAIAQSRLPKTASSDRNYLNAVAKHLNSGGCSSI